ncbi:MAG: hypothetical protein AAGG68_10165 [Bacteroidota bacterium]
MDSTLFYALIFVFGLFLGMGVLSNLSRRTIHGIAHRSTVRSSVNGILWNATVFVAIVVFFCYVLGADF